MARMTRANSARTLLAALVTAGATLAATGGVAGATPLIAGGSGPILSNGVPPKFAPASTSWTSVDDGWVYGETLYCPSGDCPTLLRTTDGGQTWRDMPAPDVPPSDFGGIEIRVTFANDRVGVIDNAANLFVTTDGAQHWTEAPLPITAGDDMFIEDVTATDDYIYAVARVGMYERAQMRIFYLPNGSTTWRSADGGKIRGAGGGDITQTDGRVYATLSSPPNQPEYFVSDDGVAWRELGSPCEQGADAQITPAPHSGFSNGPSQRRMLALCSYDPRVGSEFKNMRIGLGDGQFQTIASAPEHGYTTGFVAPAPDTMFITAVGGASIVYATFDGGQSWVATFWEATYQAGFIDLDFQDASHGVMVWGGPHKPGAALYRTTDGGHTWTPIIGYNVVST
nr:BNR/Asp-box repeat protein [uncultured bacterium]